MSAAQPSDPKARALRTAFDLSFATPMAGGRAAGLDFLAIRVAGDPFALRLSEVASLHVSRKLTRAPSVLPELLGLAGVRGALAPVYDLGALLGSEPQPSPRWLVLAQHPSLIGFAFESLEMQIRVPLDATLPGAGSSIAIRSGALTLPVLELPGLIAAITRRIKAAGPAQER